MRYKFFTIPVFDPAAGEEALNSFLASHRIVAVEKQWYGSEQNPAWCFVVSYEGEKTTGAKRATMDYKEILDDDDFQRFARLRELRNRLTKEEGVPAYSVFTNEQLAVLVTQRVTTVEAMAAIPGIGKSRIERYAKTFLPLLQELFP